MPRKPGKAAADKLNALLGITEKAAEVQTRSTGKIVGITEPEIQEFREAQGLVYFLQAPALFSPRVCANPDCGEPFMVSRKHVAFCSYTCIKANLARLGFTFTKGNDLEALANDPQVYEGNEPIWIRQRTLIKALETLQTLLEPIKQEDGTYKLIQSRVLEDTSPSKSQESTKPLSPSDGSQTLPSINSTPGKQPSVKKETRRIVSFG